MSNLLICFWYTLQMNNREVAKALIKIGAVGFVPEKPITFKSGIISPVYVDNRKFPFHPKEWRTVIEGFEELIKTENISFDVIAGVEAAGIPHSAALGFYLSMPSVFVRKTHKDHGTKSLIEGGDVKDKRVLLIEDLVTTGLSSLASIEALRTDGAIAGSCLSIVSYGFGESHLAFDKAKVKLYPLTSFTIILEEAVNAGKLTKEQSEKVGEWFDDPRGWGAKYGFI